MANTLTNLIPDLYKALDVVSRELVGFIPSVNRNSTVEEAAKDQPVKVPIVGAESSQDITPGVTAPDNGDMAPDNVNVTISKSKYVPVRWNGEEQKAVDHTGIYDNIQQDRFAQAFRTLCNEVETDVAALHIKASRAYGVAGTTPFGTADNLTDASFALKILNDNGAPNDRHITLDTTATATLRGKQPGLFRVNEAGDGGALLRAGAVGNMFGADMHESGQVASHVAGTGSAYTTDTAGYAEGDTVITLITGTGTVLAGDAVTFAGDSNIYMVASGVAAPGAITLAEPGLRQAIAGSATALTILATSTRNMVYSRSAIVLATRVPAMPKEGDSADDVMIVTDPVSGLSFQVALYKQYRQAKFEVGLAWGQEMIAPRHCGILLG